jgi:hypothetical protein
MVWTIATYETHRILYLQILNVLCTFLGITTQKTDGVHLDSSCQNESRFFYYTAVRPKEFYLNLNSTLYEPLSEKGARNRVHKFVQTYRILHINSVNCSKSRSLVKMTEK